jgi:hypothetical protein
MIYDLCSPKTTAKTLTAHNTSVTSMVFKHRVDRQQVAQVMSVVKNRLLKHKSTPFLMTVQEDTKEHTEPGKEMLETDWVDKEVFVKADYSVFMKDDGLFSK